MLTNGNPLFDDTYQDFDTIRRPCAGGSSGQGGFLPAPTNNGTVQPPFPSAPAEQVCGPKGTLGENQLVVLRKDEHLYFGMLNPQ